MHAKFKWFGLLLSAILAVAPLAACSGSGETSQAPAAGDGESAAAPADSGGSESAAEPGGDVVTINVHSWDNEYAVEEVTQRYNEGGHAANVNLVLTPWDDYQNKLFISLAGGEDIDAFYIRLQDAFPSYASKSMLLPLDDMMAGAGYDITQFGAYADQMRIDGVTLAVPYRGSGFYLYYNKDAFDAAGVDYPGENMTWAEYREMAGKLTSGEGSEKMYGSFFEPSNWILPFFSAMQQGVKLLDDDYNTDITDPKVKDALEYYKTMTDEDQSQPTVAEMKATSMATTGAFVTKRTATVMAGEWFPGTLASRKEQGELDFEWGFTRVPCDVTPYVSTGLASKACINAQAKNPAEAFDYLAYVTGPEGQMVIAEAGSKPALVTDEIMQIYADAFGFSETDKEIFFEVPLATNEPQNDAASYTKQILEEEYSLYFTGEQDVDTTIQNMYDRLEEALEEFR